LRPIDPTDIQTELARKAGRDVYLHLETTTGSYTSLAPEPTPPCIAFVRNARIRYERGAVKGPGPYRVGLKIDDGWVYGDGLTHAEVDDEGRLLMAGYDDQGRVRLAFQISETPFREGVS